MNAECFEFGLLGRARISEFKYAIEQGFDFIELSTNPGTVSNFLEQVALIKRWQKYFSVPIAAMGYFGAEDGADPDEYDRLVRVMDACCCLGVPLLHMGVGSLRDDIESPEDTAIQLLGRALKDAQARGLQLALYTCQVSNFAWVPTLWPAIFEALPRLGLKYDPSHAFHATPQRAYLKEIASWARQIVHFHAKGGSVTSMGHRDPLGDPPVGEDQIDWASVLSTLIQNRYKGKICIEMHADRYSHSDYYRVLKNSRDFLRRLNFDLAAQKRAS